MESLLLDFSIGLALAFAFLNGFHDGSNVVATSILSRSISPRKALLVASVAEIAGAILFGSAVARAISQFMTSIFSYSSTELFALSILFSALGGMILWSSVAWWVGIPPSSSHSLLGGLLGGALAATGMEAIHWIPLLKFAIFLFVAPLVGALAGAVLSSFQSLRFGRNYGASGNFPRIASVAGLLFLSMNHGSNNAQKQVALVTLGLLASGYLTAFEIPLWVPLACGTSLALGIYLGGWNIVKILGNRVFNIKPVHSFSCQALSGSILMAATLAGTPVNGVEVIKSTVLGMGAGKRTRKIYERLTRDILMAWTMTLPVTGLVAAAIYWIVSGVLGIGMNAVRPW